MKKYFLKISFMLMLLLAAGLQIHAQQGGCSGGGSVGNNQYVNYTGTAAGDQNITSAGKLEIGPSGIYTIYGAIINDGIITINAGGVLNVYGNFVNNNTLKVAPGGTINFYGALWSNAVAASVTDNDVATNTTPGGDINFIAPRPDVSPSFLANSPCLAAYSGGDALQQIEGGDVPMDIALHVLNANNIQLANSATRIEGAVSMDVDLGDIILNDEDLILTNNAAITGYSAQRMIVTGNSITGHMVKEGYTGDFTFPVGIAEQDYTPALVSLSATGTIHTSVQDYTPAVPEIQAPEEGMNRTWHIFADAATTAALTLYHNEATSPTNGTDYVDNMAFITQYQGAGTWSAETAPDYVAAGIHTHSGKSIPGMGTDDGDWFTKTSDESTPLPIHLLSFNASAENCNALLQWNINPADDVSQFIVESSRDGKQFEAIKDLPANHTDGSYSYTDDDLSDGLHYYRLKMTETNGSYNYSPVRNIKIRCDKREILIYPNPAKDVVYIKGLQAKDNIKVYNVIGQQIDMKEATDNIMSLDLSGYAAGNYMVVVTEGSTTLISAKIVKTK